MKKIIFSFVLVFLMINYSYIFAKIPNWEFIPESGSYLENENFAFLDVHDRIEYATINYIKVKSNQDYIFISKTLNVYILEIEIFLYGESKEFIDILNYEPNLYYCVIKFQ